MCSRVSVAVGLEQFFNDFDGNVGGSIANDKVSYTRQAVNDEERVYEEHQHS